MEQQQITVMGSILKLFSVPSASPNSLSCSSVSSTSVHLSWAALEEKDFNGISQGYLVFLRPLREWEGNYKGDSKMGT